LPEDSFRLPSTDKLRRYWSCTCRNTARLAFLLLFTSFNNITFSTKSWAWRGSRSDLILPTSAFVRAPHLSFSLFASCFSLHPVKPTDCIDSSATTQLSHGSHNIFAAQSVLHWRRARSAHHQHFCGCASSGTCDGWVVVLALICWRSHTLSSTCSPSTSLQLLGHPRNFRETPPQSFAAAFD